MEYIAHCSTVHSHSHSHSHLLLHSILLCYGVWNRVPYFVYTHETVFTMRKGKSPVRFISIRHYLSPLCICCHSQYVRSVYNTHTHAADLLWCCQTYVATTYKQFSDILNGGNLSWKGNSVVFPCTCTPHKTDMHTHSLIHSYNIVWLNICVSYGRERELNHMHTAVWWITTNQNSHIYMNMEIRMWTLNSEHYAGWSKIRNAFSKHETLSIWMGFSFCFFPQK